MKKFRKKFLSVCAAVFVLIGCLPAVPASAEEYWPTGPVVEAESAILMDADTGAVLYEKNPDQQMYPASITKIMTALLALENSSLDETVVFSEDAVYKNEQNSSHIARDLDEEMTMEETLYAVLLESANECAYAVAEHVGDGDYQAFIDMMNERAVELGCTNTHFTNANGLPDEEHVTTARDMALIAQEAIKNSTFREMIGTLSYTIPPTNKHDDPTYLNNHNRMINPYKGSEHLYEYCIGGKTGYTEAAGNTLVTYAEKDGRLLISVVLKTTAPYDDSIALFEYGFNDFTTYNVAANETRYMDAAEAESVETEDVETESTEAESAEAVFDSGDYYVELDPDARIILPLDASFDDTQTEMAYDEASDDVLGTLTYYYDGKDVGSAQVRITGVKETGNLRGNDSEAGVRGSRSGSGLIRTIIRWVVVILIIIVVILLIIIIRRWRIRRRRAKRRQNSQNSRGRSNSGRSNSSRSNSSRSNSSRGNSSRNSYSSSHSKNSRSSHSRKK